MTSQKTALPISLLFNLSARLQPGTDKQESDSLHYGSASAEPYFYSQKFCRPACQADISTYRTAALLCAAGSQIPVRFVLHSFISI